MRVSKSGLYIDNPSAKLLDWLGSYEGVTTANGNALGTTVVCDGLANEPSYLGGLLKILDGPAAGQARPIAVQAGNTATVAAAFTDSTGAVVQITASTRFVILTSVEWLIAAILGDVAKFPGLTETWQDVLGIDFTVWTVAVTGTGAVARSVAEEPYQKVVLTGPVNADTARIRSVQQWQGSPDTIGLNTIQKRLVVEWEARFVLVASINNPTFFMGWANIAAATRASNGIVGFILTADVLNSITDDGGAETVKAVGAPVLTNWHKYRIEVDSGRVRFYIDEALVATHTTAAVENLPDVNSFLQFYLPQEAGANSGELHVSTVIISPEAMV